MNNALSMQVSIKIYDMSDKKIEVLNAWKF